jgi:hypothetical protein
LEFEIKRRGVDDVVCFQPQNFFPKLDQLAPVQLDIKIKQPESTFPEKIRAKTSGIIYSSFEHILAP